MRLGYDGVVLAGGRSERFGKDKAMLTVRGEALWERQCRVMRGVGAVRVLVGCGRQRVLSGGAEMVGDGVGEGPLAGIAACADRVRVGSMVMVCAVDSLGVGFAFWRRLKAEVRCGVGCIPVLAGRPQPLLGVYPWLALCGAERLLREGERRVGVWVDCCVAMGLVRKVELPREWAGSVANVNTEAEFDDWVRSDSGGVL